MNYYYINYITTNTTTTTTTTTTAPKLWNSLPTSLISLSSTPSFKRKLKTYLFSIAYQ